MIITLKGKVTVKKAAYAVIEVGGIGHQVFMPTGLLSELKVGEISTVWTHEHLREDARDLYGFRTEKDHSLFERLLDVSGVGPKVALHIMSLGASEDIERHIENGDVAWISRVPGVGKKTAQKIILELKGKLADVEGGSAEDEEVLVALTNLGYSREAAREAVAATATEGARVEDRLRNALRELGRK